MNLFKAHWVIVIALLLLLISCENYKTINIFSPDETQCITVLLDENKVYIISGDVRKVPKKNFVKLDWSNRDLAETLNVCWEKEGSNYKWDVVLENALIEENKLDTSIFKFSTNLPNNAYGVPTEIKFRSPNCSTVNLIDCRDSPPSNTIIRCQNQYYFSK